MILLMILLEEQLLVVWKIAMLNHLQLFQLLEVRANDKDLNLRSSIVGVCKRLYILYELYQHYLCALLGLAKDVMCIS